MLNSSPVADLGFPRGGTPTTKVGAPTPKVENQPNILAIYS